MAFASFTAPPLTWISFCRSAYNEFVDSTRKVGGRAEDLACNFLAKQGYKILARNYTIRGGEIDIIARDQENLVFVEVKARFSHKFGLPEESITPWKIHSLKKTALFYIQKIRWENRPYRFDLVGIDFVQDWQNPKINLIQNITS